MSDITGRVWDILTQEQRECDYVVWIGNPKKPESYCKSCEITLRQYNQHEKETRPRPNTPFWTWRLQYEQRKGIENDYRDKPIS